MCKWLFQDRTNSMVIPQSDYSQDEFNFMLSQLNIARDLVDNSRKRGEQGIAFCLTLWTALLAAVISITSSNNFNQNDYLLVFGVALIAGSIPGLIAFGAFISAITASGISRSRYLTIREYFLNRFPDTRKYIDYRSSENLVKSWKDNFRTGVMVFLHLFAFGVSALWAGGLTLLSLHLLAFYKLQNISTVIVAIDIISGLISFVLFEFYIFRKRRKVKQDFEFRFISQKNEVK